MCPGGSHSDLRPSFPLQKEARSAFLKVSVLSSCVEISVAGAQHAHFSQLLALSLRSTALVAEWVLSKAVSQGLVFDNASFLFEPDLEVVFCLSTAVFPRSQSQLLTRLGVLSLKVTGGSGTEQGFRVSS